MGNISSQDITLIYGGTFDPIHNGHIMLARYVASLQDVKEVWLMISPQNPLKQSSRISDDRTRLKMASIALEDEEAPIRVSDFETLLPKPTYTAETLRRLSQKYPERRFGLLIGSDNWLCFDLWREAPYILSHHPIFIYPRPGYEAGDYRPEALSAIEHPSVTYLENAPLADISSTHIRSLLAAGISPEGLTPKPVADFILENHERLYR
ncbi:MAG: nicotinate (nicotinamide) nucleotide adenylyltransferase [Bacteroidales bacterium]|nr:nicotinate (nicotinamide) nucleotide adenylyltransferase [Bacteroidales bacterium]